MGEADDPGMESDVYDYIPLHQNILYPLPETQRLPIDHHVWRRGA